MDGAYGAASEDFTDFNTLLLVGAGIGVTPFASILKSLLFSRRHDANFKVKKIYFFWICREYKAFEWFQDLLREWELVMRESGDEFLSINIYLTEKMKKEEMDALQQQSNSNRNLDSLTALESRTNFGRPDFGKIFDTISQTHPTDRMTIDYRSSLESLS